MFFYHTEASLNCRITGHFPSWTWLSNQTLQSSTMQALQKEQNGTRCESVLLFHNLGQPKFPFAAVETSIFQELTKLSQDRNAMEHRLLVLLMGNKTKTVAWRTFALAGNRTRASRVAGENSTTEPPVLVRLSRPTNYRKNLGLVKRLKLLIRRIIYEKGPI